MKKLILCEGPNEAEIVNILLNGNRLTFSIEDVIDLHPFAARQLTSTPIKLALSIYTGEFEILRIGDTMTDKLKIPSEYKNRILSIERFCTKPELEMLLIISENLTSQYNKGSSKTTPKSFAKQYIRCNGKKYNNSTAFYTDYYSSNLNLLTKSLIEYKKIKNHKNKDDKYLADLLK